jgi:hypothetical protein
MIMKAIKSILISLAIGLFFMNPVVANNFNTEIKVENKKLFLSLENISSQTSVKFVNREGATLIEEKITVSGQFESVFDLESLPFGSYTLIIKSDFKETVQPITITAKELIMEESDRAAYFPANFTEKRGRLTLSLLNPENHTINVFVMDHLGRVVYRDSINDQAVVEKEYNLKKFPAGKYTVVVDNGDQSYTRYVKLR